MNFKRALAFLLFFLATFAVNGCQAHHHNPKPADPGLVDAAREGDKASVIKALKRGANVEEKNSQGWTAIEWAGYRGDAAVVALLLDSGAKQKNPALLRAAPGGPAVIIELPAESTKEAPKVNPELEGMGDTVGTVKLLLDRGADIETRDEAGATPLIVAASYGRLATVKLLLERGAQLEARNNDGNTALLVSACDCAVASMPDTEPVVEFLLGKGAQINSQNRDGDTALTIASTGGVVKTDIVRVLLEKGANIHIRNNQGETALTIASTSNVPEVVRLLKQAQAKARSGAQNSTPKI